MHTVIHSLETQSVPDEWPRKMHKNTTLYWHYMLVHGKEEYSLLKSCSERVWLGGHAPGGKIQGFDFLNLEEIGTDRTGDYARTGAGIVKHWDDTAVLQPLCSSLSSLGKWRPPQH